MALILRSGQFAVQLPCSVAPNQLSYIENWLSCVSNGFPRGRGWPGAGWHMGGTHPAFDRVP